MLIVFPPFERKKYELCGLQENLSQLSEWELKQLIGTEASPGVPPVKWIEIGKPWSVNLKLQPLIFCCYSKEVEQKVWLDKKSLGFI